jgi:murein DD-endopeptidase MepM/ murein hydrolase activator NlpD
MASKAIEIINNQMIQYNNIVNERIADLKEQSSLNHKYKSIYDRLLYQLEEIDNPKNLVLDEKTKPFRLAIVNMMKFMTMQEAIIESEKTIGNDVTDELIKSKHDIKILKKYIDEQQKLLIENDIEVPKLEELKFNLETTVKSHDARHKRYKIIAKALQSDDTPVSEYLKNLPSNRKNVRIPNEVMKKTAESQSQKIHMKSNEVNKVSLMEKN